MSAQRTVEPLIEVTDISMGAISGVAIRGEVELATTPELATAIDEAIRASCGPFVIDLSLVDFLDSSGISCLVRARAFLGRDERPLVLICPPGIARRALELTGIVELVAVYGSREELAQAQG
jgi:anti-sigma B factor antagonist